MTELNIPSPCYVLDKKLLNDNLKIFKKIQEESSAWALCALKGFAFYHVFDEVSKIAHGATASSLHEAMLANEYFDEVHVCAPVYLDHEFDQITDIASHLTFNTLNQYERFNGRLKENNVALLRINPEYSEVETDLYDPCKSDGRLGVTKLELLAHGGLPKGVNGIHIHALCENDSFTFDRLFNDIEDNFSHELHTVDYLNIGGGHLVTKEGYDLDHFIQRLKSISDKYKLQIILEPGSAFGWQTGFLKSEVQDVIVKPDTIILMLDVSFSAHMPDCLEMPYQPDVRGFSKEIGKLKIKFGGNTCLAGDELGGYFVDEIPKIGDTVIFEDMIHYTMVKTTTFNGVPLPSIGMMENEEFKLLNAPSFEDYKSRL